MWSKKNIFHENPVDVRSFDGTKKIRPVSDLDPDPGFESGSETNFRPDPDPKLDPKFVSDPQHWK
jgi:hypothetical protein